MMAALQQNPGWKKEAFQHFRVEIMKIKKASSQSLVWFASKDWVERCWRGRKGMWMCTFS